MSTTRTTFTIRAFTRQFPQIEFKQDKLPPKFSKLIAGVLMSGFRDIDITDDQTGEVVFSHYVSGPFWNERQTPADCLREVERMLENGEDYYADDDED